MLTFDVNLDTVDSEHIVLFGTPFKEKYMTRNDA